MLRWYTRIIGVVLALLGLAGLLGMKGFDFGHSLLFVGTALIFLYASSRSMASTHIRSILGGMGVICGTFGVFVIVVSFDLGAYSEIRGLIGDLVYIALGVVCVCGALFLPCEDDEPPVDPKALLRRQRGNRERRWYQRR